MHLNPLRHVECDEYSRNLELKKHWPDKIRKVCTVCLPSRIYLFPTCHSQVTDTTLQPDSKCKATHGFSLTTTKQKSVVVMESRRTMAAVYILSFATKVAVNDSTCPSCFDQNWRHRSSKDTASRLSGGIHSICFRTSWKGPQPTWVITGYWLRKDR